MISRAQSVHNVNQMFTLVTNLFIFQIKVHYIVYTKHIFFTLYLIIPICIYIYSIRLKEFPSLDLNITLTEMIANEKRNRFAMRFKSFFF